jgi:hypothetical protein
LTTTVWAQIGLYIAPEDRYGAYFVEALLHLGLTFRTLGGINSDELYDLDVLVLCGYGELSETQIEKVSDLTARGGCVVCCGSPWGLNGMLGLDAEGVHLSNAVAKPLRADRLWPADVAHVRFFGGVLAAPKRCETVAATESGKAAVCRHKVGRGAAWFVGPHVAQTMALMQMGRSVETDAIGPSDGSALLDDGDLRAEDGTNLSFESDRGLADGCATPYFAYPHADVVRELLVRSILEAVDHTGKSTVVIWQWPNMAPAGAMMTLDCEDFAPEHVYRTYQLLSLHGCQAAWLIGRPGYALAVYRSFRAWEHEVGCLFAADGRHAWTGDRLKLQHLALTRAASVKTAVASRPQGGRWQGWDAFYSMCETSGARVSVSKGGRQPGTAGFLFGTCHPFFPRRSSVSDHLVAEVPYTVYMPGLVTPDPVCDAVFATTVARSGCFHMACRPESISNLDANASLRRLLSLCRQNRVRFQAPEQLWRFEKARRSLRRMATTTGEDSQLLLIPDAPMEGLTVMLSGPAVGIEIKSRAANVRQIECYGTRFSTVQVDVEQKQHLELRLTQYAEQPAA